MPSLTDLNCRPPLWARLERKLNMHTSDSAPFPPKSSMSTSTAGRNEHAPDTAQMRFWYGKGKEKVKFSRSADVLVRSNVRLPAEPGELPSVLLLGGCCARRRAHSIHVRSADVLVRGTLENGKEKVKKW